MKKSVIGFIFGAILMLSVNVAADTYYQFVASQNTLYVDDVKVEYPMYNYQYTNYASIRGVAEALGLDIKVTDKRIDFTSPLTDLETVAKNCKDSCVMIYAKSGTTIQGSGWVYGDYVITAKHVVNGAREIQVFMDDSIYGVYGTIYYLDPDLDIAVLKADTKMPSVVLGDSSKLKEGQRLVSITSPQNAINAIDECVYSGKANYIEGIRMILSESNMLAGSSGGAIFDFDGNIVAMTTAGASDVGELATAIPINDIKPILEKLK
jgi:S1-C subfamily serine protease